MRLSCFGAMDESGKRHEELRALAARLGLSFADFGLLDRALTHASATPEAPDGPGHNESLEFLGDAVLGLAVAQWLYGTVPERGPGEYTQMRARVVNRHALAQVAQRLGIGPAIRLGRGEEASGGRSRKALLADCVEAIIGAVFIDCGWEAAREFVGKAFSDELDQALHPQTEWDFRSRLQNHCQANRIPLPEFVVTSEHGPDHQKVFEVAVRLQGEVIGSGRGPTKKQAEQDAARAALKYGGLGPT